MTEQIDKSLTRMGVHERDMENLLGRFGATLDKRSYEAAAARIWIDERPPLDWCMVDLRIRLQRAQDRLSVLRAASAEKWEVFRADLEFAVREFETALNDGR